MQNEKKKKEKRGKRGGKGTFPVYITLGVWEFGQSIFVLSTPFIPLAKLFSSSLTVSHSQFL